MTSPTAATGVVALLGHPVAHSASPAMHNAAFASEGVDAVYVALDVAPDRLDDAVAGLDALGFLGANVTVPHKEGVYRLVGTRTPAAEACGAVNTLFRRDGLLVADNTDIEGLELVLRRDVDLGDGDSVVLFGAGGAARAAAVALGRMHATVEVAARRADAADDVAALAAEHGATIQAVEHARLVINATPLGLYGEPLPGRFMQLGTDQVALDLVYGPADTPFLAAARAAGARGFDGTGMLVAQAAAAFERWTGLPAPQDVMRAAGPGPRPA
ncbi:MAG: shikimate dehydrogenase [Nitriliruptorales bacterium]|nr:shikimate dehydrogenase [Nitriliruptorales bacterium]